jgi:hypothetical protein
MTATSIKDHHFDLSGLKVGDSFLGCPKCWFQHEPEIAAKPECPDCREQMLFYTVTPEDLKP